MTIRTEKFIVQLYYKPMHNKLPKAMRVINKINVNNGLLKAMNII